METHTSTSGASQTANRPVHVVKYWPVKAAIWKNETANGFMYNVSVSRTYREGAGEETEWKESSGFGQDDLLLLAKAVDEAHTWITRQRAEEREQSQG